MNIIRKDLKDKEEKIT